MSDYPPPPLPPLNLPSAALHIHNHARQEAYPDSEDAVRHERQRFARELEPVRRERDATLNEAHATPNFGSLRSRNTSLRNDGWETSRSELRRYASTQADTVGQGEAGAERSCRFYDPVIKFWTTEISITIDEGAHRDHLGMSLSLTRINLIDTLTSARAYVSRLPPHFTPPCNDGYYNRPALPSATQRYPRCALWFLQDR